MHRGWPATLGRQAISLATTDGSSPPCLCGARRPTWRPGGATSGGGQGVCREEEGGSGGWPKSGEEGDGAQVEVQAKTEFSQGHPKFTTVDSSLLNTFLQ